MKHNRQISYRGMKDFFGRSISRVSDFQDQTDVVSDDEGFTDRDENEDPRDVYSRSNFKEPKKSSFLSPPKIMNSSGGGEYFDEYEETSKNLEKKERSKLIPEKPRRPLTKWTKSPRLKMGKKKVAKGIKKLFGSRSNDNELSQMMNESPNKGIHELKGGSRQSIKVGGGSLQSFDIQYAQNMKVDLEEFLSKIPKFRVYPKITAPRNQKNVKTSNYERSLLYLFQFLPPFYLLDVIIICKYWYNIIHSVEFWRNYFENFFGHLDYFEFSRDRKNMLLWKNHFVEEYLKYQKCFNNIEFDSIQTAVLGEGNCGKSSFANVLNFGSFPEEREYTLGANVFLKSIYMRKNDPIQFKIWDVGSGTFLKTSHLYYKSSDLVFVFYDITNPTSFEIATELYKEVQKKHVREKIDIVFIGNKIDLEEEREVKETEIQYFVKNNEIVHFEISLKETTKTLLEKFLVHAVLKTIEKKLFN